jgi:cobalt-zinc-cadmium efflux system outer membrane protein
MNERIQSPRRRLARWIGVFLVALCFPEQARAQVTPTAARALSLAEARRMAFAASPDLTAAREGAAAARGRERQAGVLTNPVFSLAREQTSGGTPRQTSSQNVLTVDQTFDWRATRTARVDAARLRREAAEARVAALESQIAFDVARAYSSALVAERRAALADEAARAFADARTVSERRLAAGDVAGYSVRRIRLEAARYATLRAEAQLSRRTARLTLAALVAPRVDTLTPITAGLSDSLPVVAAALATDSLTRLALSRRGDLRAAELEAQAAAADAQLVRRERTPVPTFSAGLKTERAPGVGSLLGFVAGVAVPIPLLDKRVGAFEAADAETRRREAELLAVRQRIAREVAEAAEAVRAAQDQLASLAPQIEADAAAAMRSAQAAYAEGEISLLEWLDAVRAYQETAALYASLRADLFLRRATLERVVGVTFSETVR